MRKLFMTIFALMAGALFMPSLAGAAGTGVISDFESNSLGGWSQGTLVAGDNSNYAVRLHNNANDSFGMTKNLNSPILKNYSTLEMDLNLNGNTVLDGDAAAVVFDQGGWKMVNLKKYLVNGQNGWQHIAIPLAEFTGLNTNAGVAKMTIRFWNISAGNYDVDNIKLTNGGGSTTPPPTDPTTPADPGTPSTPPAGMTIANFDAGNDGFDRGTVTNGVLNLTNPNNGDASTKKIINSPVLNGQTALEFDININGSYLLDGDASAVIFDQSGAKMISLKNRITNGATGWQHVKINLADFSGLNTSSGVASIGFRFWNYMSRTYQIDNVVLTGGSTTPVTPPSDPITPPVDPPSDPTSPDSWTVKSIDSQVMSKYWAISDDNQIRHLIEADKSLGAKQIAVSINFDNYALLKKWADIIHSEGLNVWFRGHWNDWDTWEQPDKKTGITNIEYLNRTKQFIVSHPELFRAGDAFTMCVESENGAWWAGIDSGAFTGWESWRAFTRNQVIYANDAFSQIGLGGKVKTNWINMNGWVAWNELDQTTVNVIGQLTLDHIIDWTDDTNTYTNALFSGNGNGFYGYDQYHSKWNVPMMAGEWGYSTFNQTMDPAHQKELAAAVFYEFAKRSYILGINYWIDVGHASRLFDTTNLLDYTRRPIGDVIAQYYV